MRYSAADRERLIHEQATSGLSKNAFCAQRQIKPATFYRWTVPRCTAVVRKSVAFAQVEVTGTPPAAVEVLPPNGVRVGIRQEGGRQELVALIRGVAGYGGRRPDAELPQLAQGLPGDGRGRPTQELHRLVGVPSSMIDRSRGKPGSISPRLALRPASLVIRRRVETQPADQAP